MIERKLEVRVNDESAYIIATLLPYRLGDYGRFAFIGHLFNLQILQTRRNHLHLPSP